MSANQKPGEAELKNLQELIEAHRKRLHKLRVRVALQGIDAKPEDLIEVENIERQLSELERKKQILYETISGLSKDEISKDTTEIKDSLATLEGKIENLDKRTSERGVGFTNRQYELDQILSPFSKPFIIIDAPASYGKTYLLRAVERKLQSERREVWICRSVDCYRFNDKTGIMTEITGSTVNDVNNLLPLVDRAMETARANGLMLLFDSIEHLDDKVSHWLKKNLIPALNNSSSNRGRKFRALFAGRYVGTWEDGLGLPHLTLSLTPFSKKVVQAFVQEVGKQLHFHWSDRDLDVFVEELLDITGGYPKAIVDIVEHLGDEQKFDMILDRESPDYYFQLSRKKDFYNRFVRGEIPKILQEVDLALQRAFEVVSVFRAFNADTLNALIMKRHIREWSNGWELFEAMQKNRLIEEKARHPLACDKILQRVLAAKMRFEDPSRYEGLQHFAVALYDRWIQGLKYPDGELPNPPTGSDQITFIIEALYHYLHTTQDERDILGKLDSYLNWLRSPFDPRSAARALKRGVEEDEQLPGMLKRAIGDNGYDNFLKHIDRFGEEGKR
ncbi:MAG: hypothetical protein H5T68_04735 [Chloroflexi bacterium]|nr:hypothetical protein [Chloroflexota bacterium]